MQERGSQECYCLLSHVSEALENSNVHGGVLREGVCKPMSCLLGNHGFDRLRCPADIACARK
jgi:hypothetical protein